MFKKQVIACSMTNDVKGCEILLSDSQIDFSDILKMNSILILQISMIKDYIIDPSIDLLEIFGESIYLNIEPSQLLQRLVIDALLELGHIIKNSNQKISISLEITERYSSSVAGRQFISSLVLLKSYGYRIGLDDVEMFDDRLKIKGIVPLLDFIKVEYISLNGLLVSLCLDNKISLIIEKVESTQQQETCRNLVYFEHLIQGYVYGKPINVQRKIKQFERYGSIISKPQLTHIE
ncbi:hypothetical protein L1D61_21705 [Vibrio mediterranei]|nr:hypothetical protein [Vibrio mediterranei]